MKKCTLCKKFKEPSEFYGQIKNGPNGQSWPYLDPMCKQCRSEYTSERRRRVKIQAMEYLGGRCHNCGLVDDPIVFDFHHKNPEEKDFAIGHRYHSFDTIKNELDKCVLLCAHCHRKVHGGLVVLDEE